MIRFASFRNELGRGLAADLGDGFRGLLESERGYPGDLQSLIELESDLLAVAESLRSAPPIDVERVSLLPPIPHPRKIICIGSNYADRSTGGKLGSPKRPEVFARFASSLVGHGAPLLRPAASTQFDYEGGLAVVIGTEARNVSDAEALLYVAGYSIFNDASVRDYQFRGTQWTMGKNFDGTGAFGPYLVPASQLPAGAAGLRLQTRLNGRVVQDASTKDMIFAVARQISLLSEVLTLEPGDVISTGTPSGAGFSRVPPLWMRPGDVCEVELEGVGVLRNRVEQGE